MARAQEKGLQFWQTRSHSIIRYDSVPADCIESVVSLQGDKTLYQRVSTPRSAPQIVLKDAWQSSSGRPTAEQQQQPEQQQGTPTSSGKPLAEENPFKIDLRIQGIPEDALLEDQGRMTRIQELVDKLRSEYQTERSLPIREREEKSTGQRRIKTYNSKTENC